jgi:hypothetical protein
LNKINYEDIYSASTAINLAINAVHQNGSMLDYLVDTLKEHGDNTADSIKILLSSLSKGDFIKKVNKQLKEIGLDIAKPNKNPYPLVEKEEQGKFAKMLNKNWYRIVL